MPKYLSAVAMLWAIILLMVATYVGLQLTPGMVLFNSEADLLVVHTLLEYYSAVIAILIVLVMLQQLQLGNQQSRKALLIGFGLIAVVDVLHALSLPGMPALINANSLDKSIYFWLIGRSLEVFCFAALLWRIRIPLQIPTVVLLLILCATALFLLGTVYAELLPPFYIEGVGLTPLKSAIEYSISFANLTLGFLLFRKAQRTQQRELQLLSYAAIILGSASIFFANYQTSNDWALFIGHLLKVTAYTFIYLALYRARIRDPYIQLEISEARYRAAELAAKKVAERDYLTGLGSREALFTTLEQLMQNPAKTRQYVLMLADLDSFKDINDSYGHLTGDLLLKHITVQLQQMRQEHHSLYRLGGDEFAILSVLDDNSENPIQWQARNKAEQFSQAISRPFHYDNLDLSINASIGIVIFSAKEHISPTDLLKQADLALYAAKREGKNRASFFDQHLEKIALRDAHLGQMLRLAIAQNELSLHYQPVLDAKGHIVGAEGLLRWQTSEEEQVSPAEFIPIAERSGLMTSIGDWVLEQAIRQLQLWQQDPIRQHWHISINISARQIDQQTLPQRVAALLQQYQVSGQRLVLELTESLLQDNLEQSIAVITAIRRLGVAFALDDFGTGYSSLSYLSQLPIQALKIDQSFVAGLDKAGNQAIIEAILALAKSLHLQVVAEGIETLEQLTFLRERNCHYYQGFYLAKPLPVTQLPQTIPQFLTAPEAS